MDSDAARFLADSPERLRLLERLRETPGDPRDVAADLEQSRRSVQRNLAAAAERGWAERRDGKYRLTTTGAIVVREHREYLDALETVESNDDLYRHLPREAAPDTEWLDAEAVVTAEPDHPQAPVSRYVSVVESVETDRIRMLSPVLSRIFHGAHAGRVLDGVRTDLVLDEATAAAARERNPGEFAAVVSVPRFSLYRHPDEIAFGLTVTDDRALVLAYDGDGQVRACAELTDEAALAWAADLFETYRERAERVRGRDFLGG